jgi:ribonuclease J
MSFTAKKQFYSPPFLSPRNEKSLQELGILPQIKGIYTSDPALPEANAVFLSHGHLDHSAYLSFIKREIPVYCGETTDNFANLEQYQAHGFGVQCGRYPV